MPRCYEWIMYCTWKRNSLGVPIIRTYGCWTCQSEFHRGWQEIYDNAVLDYLEYSDGIEPQND